MNNPVYLADSGYCLSSLIFNTTEHVVYGRSTKKCIFYITQYTVIFLLHNWTGYFRNLCSENHTEHKNVHVWNKRTLLILRARGTYNY